MSTQQRNSACLLSVDPSTVDVLRRQTLVVLEANHYFFEELPEFGPEAQFALSVIYRDAFAVLDAIGWSPDPAAGPVDVPLTAGHIDQLRRCRFDLGHTNINRLDLLDAASTEEEAAAIRAAIDADRDAAMALDRLFADYARAVADWTRNQRPEPPLPLAQLSRETSPSDADHSLSPSLRSTWCE